MYHYKKNVQTNSACLVIHATRNHAKAWLKLRQKLWPDCPARTHKEDIRRILCRAPSELALIAYSKSGRPLGFIELSLKERVNGCSTTSIAFIEGIFVEKRSRKLGIARYLFALAEQWARRIGCRELASDANIANTTSHKVHLALGFKETERVVYFKKTL